MIQRAEGDRSRPHVAPTQNHPRPFLVAKQTVLLHNPLTGPPPDIDVSPLVARVQIVIERGQVGATITQVGLERFQVRASSAQLNVESGVQAGWRPLALG